MILVGILFVAITYVSTWALLRQKSDIAVGPATGQTQLVLYTLPGCPHCEKVHEFIERPAVSSKIKYTERSASDPAAAQELAAHAKTCGIAQDQIGVPLLWDGVNSKCLVGDQAIIDFFTKEANDATL